MKMSFLGCSDAWGLDTESPTWDITCPLWVCAVCLSFTATALSSPLQLLSSYGPLSPRNMSLNSVLFFCCLRATRIRVRLSPWNTCPELSCGDAVASSRVAGDSRRVLPCEGELLSCPSPVPTLPLRCCFCYSPS